MRASDYPKQRVSTGLRGLNPGRVSPGHRSSWLNRAGTEKVFVAPSHEEREAERKEAKLVAALEAHLKRKGHDVFRLKIVPEGEAKPIFCDLRDATADTLVEAKGSVSREAIRMAIGQIADYRRFVGDGVTPAVLVPEKPRADLLALLASQDIEAIWQTATGFVDTRGGDLT